MVNLFNYIDRPSPIHRLTGASKLIFLLLWSLAAMTSFYTPLLAGMAVLALVLFKVSKIRFKDVSFLLTFISFFMVLNIVLVFLFSPEHGTELYGTSHELVAFSSRYVLTQEQLFYHVNVVLKYLCAIPIAVLFVSTTDPSEFASSLNKIGVSYRIAYAVALALRYIPDVQREYHDISQAQQARGVEMSRKVNLIKRLKSASNILIPLIISSLDRIEVISNAMELRGFGKEKKRTWYMERKFSRGDVFCITLAVILLVLSVVLTILNGGRFFNPFV